MHAWDSDEVEVGYALSVSGARLAVDVGANDGALTLLMLAAGCQVVAIEPDRRHAQQLSDLEKRYPHSLRVHNVACSDCEGAATLHTSDVSRCNTVDSAWAESYPVNYQGAQVVPVHRLGVLCPGGADFVKIDVEGHDYQVLQGMFSSMDAPRCVMVEVNAAVDGQFDRVQQLMLNNCYGLARVFVRYEGRHLRSFYHVVGEACPQWEAFVAAHEAHPHLYANVVFFRTAKG